VFLSTLQLTALLFKSFRLRLHCYTLPATIGRQLQQYVATINLDCGYILQNMTFPKHDYCYGVALVSGIDKTIGLFCKRAL